jgi:LPPG:FO 2-phospho-L-lactate transferase
VVYALADVSDPVRGWGRRDETWTFLRALSGLGIDAWFQLGDADLAMHVARTEALGHAARLSEVTRTLAAALGIRHRIVPMSDDAVRTQLLTDEGWLDFQEYFVHRQCAPRLKELRFAGCERALVHPDARKALERADLRAVIICPSNPFVSIGPMLALPALRTALELVRAPVLAVTPIVGGKAIKGPAAKMLEELGLPVSAESVARYYDGLLDAFISDDTDPVLQGPAGIQMLRAPTLMTSIEARTRLARDVLAAADALI